LRPFSENNTRLHRQCGVVCISAYFKILYLNLPCLFVVKDIVYIYILAN